VQSWNFSLIPAPKDLLKECVTPSGVIEAVGKVKVHKSDSVDAHCSQNDVLDRVLHDHALVGQVVFKSLV
jgi:hypothetical protein